MPTGKPNSPQAVTWNRLSLRDREWRGVESDLLDALVEGAVRGGVERSGEAGVVGGLLDDGSWPRRRCGHLGRHLFLLVG